MPEENRSFLFDPQSKKIPGLLRGIIDVVEKIPEIFDLQIYICKEMIENKYSKALNLLTGLIKEVGRLDDKLLFVDIDILGRKLHLCENLSRLKLH
ncbi:26S proteasome non-ATPase regulatory subunit 11 [Apostasia shenzhenica]|uniref:26S proteasome non-ATPase regulatory subunit 11 n=1 Tax=Apostasia shenzhenica TaxID=1088818 RepID=A0A2I0B2D3_9ASPA|nr:26S proteasome non-ATPase regulatory subunit 11 [Apostasia shenzhenica]